MEQKVQIITDSACDLGRDLLERLRIAVVPLIVRFGTETYEDGELSMDEYWKKTKEIHPQTSQPSVGTYEKFYERGVEQGKQVLCVTVTSKHSGTFNSAYAAAQRFGDAVRTFDSLSLSLGQGLMAAAAAQAAKAGQSLSEIMGMLEDLRERMKVMIILDTLENLRLGGRAAAFIAVAERMTQALNIKTIVNVVEGQLQLMGAARSFKKALKRLAGMIEEMAPLEHLAVAHTRRLEAAQEFADRLAEIVSFPRDRIWLAEAGPALSSHAGAGVIGVMAVPVR
jgi:DegV family protein with EDD domain